DPVCGVVVAPARHRAFAGMKNAGAFELHAPGDMALNVWQVKRIAARKPPAKPTILVSRRHAGGEVYGYAQSDGNIIAMSSSLKFAIVAAGEAQFSPRTGVTMEREP